MKTQKEMRSASNGPRIKLNCIVEFDSEPTFAFTDRLADRIEKAIRRTVGIPAQMEITVTARGCVKVSQHTNH